MSSLPNLVRREIIETARTLVVKVGTNVLSKPDDTLDDERFDALAAQMHAVRQSGRQVVLVSSGAIGAGIGLLGLKQRPDDLPHLQAAGGGRIVNIASTEAIVSTAGISAYSATKAGVVGITKSFAVELGRHGITVNCVCPGPINTGMTAGIDESAKETYARRRVPLRRYGEPEEVAHMTLSLCLPASSFVNGAVIPVDGGMTIRHT